MIDHNYDSTWYSVLMMRLRLYQTRYRYLVYIYHVVCTLRRVIRVSKQMEL